MLTGLTQAALSRLQVVPGNVLLNFSVTYTFDPPINGTAPFTWSLAGGSVGSINASTGAFSTGVVAGYATIIVVDASGKSGRTTVYVNDSLSMVPDQATLVEIEAGSSFDFGATGGVPPYVFSISGNPDPVNITINSSTGVVSVSNNFVQQQNVTVSVTDTYQDVYPVICNVYGPVEIFPTTADVELNDTYQFTANYGIGPYVWAIQSGGGAVDINGLYTAPSSGIGTDAVIRVTDSNSKFSDATVSLISDLHLLPNHAPEAVLVSGTRQFTASGGTAPYVYSKFSGVGSMNGSGLYTAPATIGTAVVRATDAFPSTADVDVKVTPYIDKSIYFDGVDDYLDCGNILSFERTDAFSVSAWIKIPSAAFGSGSILSLIGRTENIGPFDFKGWNILGLANMVFSLSHSIVGGNYLEVSYETSIVPDQWFHFVITYDGSSTAAGALCYFNAVEAVADVQSDTLSGTIIANANAEIGRLETFGYYSLGNICSVSVYNVVLSQSDVTALYNSTSPGNVATEPKYANCLNYWKLGQGDTYPNLTDTKSGDTAVMTNMMAGQIVTGNAP